MSDVSPAAERFIAAAVSPLADNAEMQLMAERELRHMACGAEGTGGNESFREFSDRLYRSRRKTAGWKKALYIISAIVSLVALAPVARDYHKARIAAYQLFPTVDPVVRALPNFSFQSATSEELPGIFGEFPPAEKLLLFGDPKVDPWNKFRKLWESDPLNPAFFREYLLGLAEWNKPLPNDFIETADRIDPDNGWFRHVAAAISARKAVGWAWPTGRKRAGTKPAAPPIKDPAALAETVRLIKEAADLPLYNAHHDEVLLQRLKCLPPGDDVLGRKLTAEYLSMVPASSAWINRQTHNAVAAEARRLASLGDSQGFLRLIGAWEILLRRSMENADSLWPTAGLDVVSEQISVAAEELGLHEISARFMGIKNQIDASRRERLKRYNAVSENESISTVRFTNLSSSVRDAPRLTSDDLKPARMAEHAMLAKLHSVANWLVTLLSLLLLFSIRFSPGNQVRRLSASLARVLGTADHAWILGVGVLLPFMIYQGTELFTPLGGNRSSISISGFSEIARSTGIVVLLISLPCLMADRLLTRRLAILGWKSRWPILCFFILLGTIAWAGGCIAGYYGVGEKEHPATGLIRLLAILSGTAVVLPVFIAVGPRRTAIQRHVLARAMVPALVFVLLLNALAIPLAHSQEKQWMQRDTLTRIDPSVPAWSRYDHEILLLRRAEMLKILDAKP